MTDTTKVLSCKWPREFHVFSLPLSYQNWAAIKMPAPVSPEEFDYMIEVLQVMRPGLVSTANLEAEK